MKGNEHLTKKYNDNNNNNNNNNDNDNDDNTHKGLPGTAK